ncbi:MAG: phosphoglycerate kinase [Pseudomonadota bacterium]
MKIMTMNELNLKGKRVLIREDLNVPMKKGVITSDTRIQAALPTIKTLLSAKAKVMIMSHLGRPQEGDYNEDFSLAPVAKRLSELLGKDVPLIENWLDGVTVDEGDVVLCENVRFNVGEKANDEALAKKMAALCDVYVMDAFATAHRKEASTYGVAQFAPQACAGPLLEREITAIDKALKSPKKPVVAIVAGSKVSTKLKVLNALIEKVDTLIVGGGIANTFILAEGHHVGGSLCEEDFIDEAERLVALAKQTGKSIPLPSDVIVARDCSANAEAYDQPISNIADDEKILDIGEKTRKEFAKIIKNAGTILWNGPVGVFEIDQFGGGTKAIAAAIAESKAFSIAGGGDTLAAIEKYNIADKVSYISTGGGAFLACLQGETLPAIEALQQKQAN